MAVALVVPAFLVPFAFLLSDNGEALLLYLEPLWIAIGLAVLGVAVAAHLVLSRGGPRPAGTNDRP